MQACIWLSPNSHFQCTTEILWFWPINKRMQIVTCGIQQANIRSVTTESFEFDLSVDGVLSASAELFRDPAQCAHVPVFKFQVNWLMHACLYTAFKGSILSLYKLESSRKMALVRIQFVTLLVFYVPDCIIVFILYYILERSFCCRCQCQAHFAASPSGKFRRRVWPICNQSWRCQWAPGQG